jgi:myosin-7
VDCRQATARICSATLGKTDYQLGQTKVFLKDAQDLFLEQERDRVLTKKLVIIQRCIRGWIHRRRYIRLKSAAIVIQRQWRRQAQRKRYLEMRSGFLRLQALIRSRILSHRFQHLRGHIVGLQARCRGYLIRRQFRMKTRAVVVIQKHVRRRIAQRNYKEMKKEQRHRLEALRLRDLEERQLKKEGNKRYREIADQHYRVRIHLKKIVL